MKKQNKFEIKNILMMISCLLLGILFYRKYIVFLTSTLENQKYFGINFGLIILSLIISILTYFILTNIRKIGTYLKKLFIDITKVRFIGVGKKMLICIANVIIVAIFGLLLLVGVYSIPLDKIDYNVQQSSFTIYQEGSFHSIFDWCVSYLDNYTDSLILLEAAYDSKEDTLNNALMVRCGSFDGEPFPMTMIQHYIYNETFSAAEYKSDYQYPRYWHGNLLFVKPLLTVFNYSQIRKINLCCQELLMAIVLLLIYKKGYKKFVIPYLLVYLMLNPFVNGFSLQYSSCYYISNIAVIILLLMGKDKINKYGYLIFLNIGIATAYYDFLTYPYITFAIPFAFYLIQGNDENETYKINWFIKLGIVWVLGYLLMWGSKWVLASTLTENNVIADALNMLRYRTSSADVSFDKVIVLNYVLYLMQPTSLVCIIYVIFCYKRREMNYDWYKIMPYILIFIIPVLWYLIVGNHSFIHYRFTFKGCTASMTAVLFSLASISRSKDEDE